MKNGVFKCMLSCLFLTIILPGNVRSATDPIRSRTQVVTCLTDPDCIVYRTTFYHTNFTPEWTDDRVLGVHDVLDCDWNHLMVPADLSHILVSEDGVVRFSPDTEWVTVAEYKYQLAKRQACEEDFYLSHRWIRVEGSTQEIPIISIRQIPLEPRQD